MIEETIKDHLEGKGYTVSFEKMDAEKYVLLEKTGGKEEEHLTFSTFAVQSCAESLAEAAKQAYDLKKDMRKLEDLDEVVDVSLNAGPYNFTDPTTRQYRYQMVYDIEHYEDEET